MIELDPKLVADTAHICDLELCKTLLMNNKLYPWVILVPKHDGMVEITDLSEQDQQQLFKEITHVSSKMQAHYNPTKMNIAALGNQVRQLHVHIIARFDTDQAWPNPVWGQGSEVYDDVTIETEKLSKLLSR